MVQVINCVGKLIFVELVRERTIIYGTPKVYLLVYESQLVVLIQYDLNYIDTLTPSFCQINFDVILYPRLRL
jgi:hypothetical protein